MIKKILISCILTSVSFAEYTHTALDFSTVSGKSIGGAYQHTGSMIPLGGITSQNEDIIHYSGFASGFILQPYTSHHQLADEWSFDNDADGLNDAEELILGSNLNKIDTDEDGANDYQEMIAGTIPYDASSILRLYYQADHHGNLELSWNSVDNRIYTIKSTDSLMDGVWENYPVEFVGNNALLSLTEQPTVPYFSALFYKINVRLAD